MAKKAARKAARKGGGKQALVMKKIEWFPISNSQNSMYTDKLLKVLDKRIRKDPSLWVFYGSNGRIMWTTPVEQGTAKLRSMVAQNKKKHWFEKFGVYTVSKKAYLNDMQALATRLIGNPQIGAANFARAKNTTDEVKRDINQWANQESRKINRSLRPLERKYKRSLSKLDTKEKKLRRKYLKRIDKAKDKMRQKKLRGERDKKIMALHVQRKKLDPWRRSIAMWNGKLKSFQAVKM